MSGKLGVVFLGIQDAFVIVALAGALWGVSVYDVTTAKPTPAPVVASVPEEEVEPPASPPPPPPEIVPPPEVLDPEPRIRIQFTPSSDLGRMGVSTTSGDPDNDSDDNLKLTFAADGHTCNTLVRIDDLAVDYGSTSVGSDRVDHHEIAPGQYESEWRYRDIHFKQLIELIYGDVSRRLDTVRVTMTAVNEGTAEPQVGVRYMIDTYIGKNDGVPFIVAGHEKLVTHPITFRNEEVPDFVRALQNPSLSDPGVIVDIGLKKGDVQRPDELVLSYWPGNNAGWDYDRIKPLGSDSAAGLYFNPTKLGPGEKRAMGFTYGLGFISSTKSKNAQLSLTAGGPFHAGGSFWLVALVQDPQPGAELEIKLPEGLKLDPAHHAKKSVTDKFSQSSWLIVCDPRAYGDREIKVALNPGNLEEKQIIKVQPPTARLTARAPANGIAGKSFWVSAIVRNPKANQEVEVVLPKGLSLHPDHAARKPVSGGHDFVQVNWLVKPDLRAQGDHKIQIKLEPDGITANCETNLQSGNLID